MKPRSTSSAGQATTEWLLMLSLVALFALFGHRLMFAPLRSAYQRVADCVTLDRCDVFRAF